MSEPPNYMLDTGLVLHIVRGSAAFQAIDAIYQLTQSRFRPLICVVTRGEIRAIAYRRGWGEKKLRELDALLDKFVYIDISDPAVIEAYARMSARATERGWALHSQKNDLWIAAAAQVTGSVLLTMDHDFTSAHEDGLIERILFDHVTGAVVP